ncbi:hypothetical protein [Sphingomonas sp. T9W2]|uniref:hypothetical protein n=1 Tax=Sphingomonas sp. T9W2 TaxID=3143183 RepID=UPI0031F4C362
MTTLPDLDRRLSRKIESGKGMQLSAADLDLFVSTGAYATFRLAVEECQRDQCRQRSARNRSTSGANTSLSAGLIEPTSKSAGTMSSESASEALARAQAATRPGGLRSIATTSNTPRAKQSVRPAAKSDKAAAARP